MEVQASSRPARPWYGRGWAKALSALVLVAGLVMGGVGIAALLAASDTNDEAATTRSQAEAAEGEARSLEDDSEDALADAEEATTEAEALGVDTSAVNDAVIAVRDDTDLAIDAGNVMTDCGAIQDNGAFIACTRDALVGFESSLQTQRTTIAELRTELDALEEALR